MFNELVLSLAVIALCVIGLLYFWSWQRWIRKRADYDLARRMLSAIYDIREAIRDMRNPFGTTDEMQARRKKLQKSVVALDLEAFEASSVWGQEVNDLLAPLREAVSKLLTHYELYMRQLQNPERRILDERTSEQIDEIMYDLDDLALRPSVNVFTNELLQAVHQVELYLKPHLKY